MINPEELRIGNIVFYKDANEAAILQLPPAQTKIAKILSVGTTEIIIQAGEIIKGVGNYPFSCLPEELEPVPLTVGLVTQCHFQPVPGSVKEWSSEGVDIFIKGTPDEKGLRQFYFKYGGIQAHQDIYSLHELQNLFYAHTRMELFTPW